MNVLIPPAAVGGESWSNLGASFEGKEHNFVFAISINPTPALAGKDTLLESAVKDANNKLKADNARNNVGGSVFGESPSPPGRNSNRCEAAIDRLASLYTDPNFGPEYFRQNARLIKHLMLVYKTCKNNPNTGMFFLKGSKTGIHIHLNSVSKKKQLVIPVGSPDVEPIRINISDLMTWYKVQRRKAITARLKAQLEIMELKLALSKAKTAMNAASSSLDLVLGQFEVFLETCIKKGGGRGKEVASLSGWATHCWDPRATEIRNRKKELSLKTDELAKLHDDQKMYEEKDFLKLMLEGLHSVTDKFSSLARLIKEVYDGLVKCGRETQKSSATPGRYNLRSGRKDGKVQEVS